MTTLTQTAPIAIAPTCGQCQKFDIRRKVCEGRLVPWERDRSKAIRPLANSTDSACKKYSEGSPF